MMSRRGLISFSCLALLALGTWSPVAAQTAEALFTWDHSFGEAAGANNEGWGFNFGGANQTVTLNNTVDGSLQIVESGIDNGTDNGIGGAWAVTDSFNRIKERWNPRDSGGLDLFGLDSIQFDIGHNGPNPVPVQFFAFIGPSSTYTALGPDVNVNPGAVSTYTLPLAGLTPAQITTLRTVGLNVRPHTADGNLSWTINEVRSVGAGASTRLIADHDDNASDFDGAQSNFDDSAVIGRTNFGKNTEGLSINGGRLQWQESAGGPGLALEYGGCDNCYIAEDFSGRPHDLSNYKWAHVQVSVQSQIPTEEVTVEFYQQNLGYSIFGTAPIQSIVANGQIRDLWFPLSGIASRDWVDTHGINFGSHAGAALFRVYNFEYAAVPEPMSAVLLLAGALALVGMRRRAIG